MKSRATAAVLGLMICMGAPCAHGGWADRNLPIIKDVPHTETLAYPAALTDIGVDRLVLIARPFINCTHTYTYFNEGFAPGGGLYLFDENGFLQLIDAPTGTILDAALSYDAQTILFSWKKSQSVNYDLYTIGIDGSGLTQLTRSPANDFNATWLPDGGIAFLSDRDTNFAYCHDSSSAVLYRMQPDGSGLKRLSANYLSDFTPHVSSDGKIMYTRWEYVDRCQIPCQGLWAQNPDGTGLKHVYGGRLLDPVTLMEAYSIPGSNKILTTLTGHNGTVCGGIGVVDPNQGAHNPDAVEVIRGTMVRMRKQSDRDKKSQYFEGPVPVDENRFLVSNNGSIELCSYDGQSVTEVVPRHHGPAKNKIGFYAALPVRPRVREPIIESALPAESMAQTGTLIMQDVYIGLEKQLAAGLIQRGDIKQIRIVQGLGKTNKGRKRPGAAFCWQFPVVSAGATMEPKKTVSVVEVQPDGSMMCTVPAMQPLLFQALDAEGRVIHRMRTFMQMMPGEVQSCTGCHGDRNRATPSNTGRIMALQRPVEKMNGAPWAEHESAFSYPGQVQPIWDRHCIECHNARQQPGGVDLSGDRTDLFNVSYDNLARRGVSRNPSLYQARPEQINHEFISFISSYNGTEARYMAPEMFEPNSWGALKSPLAELIRSGHPDAQGNARVKLTDLEKRTVYAWIDYNIPYYPTSHANHPDLIHGMRELVPKNYTKTLQEVATRRCVECHAGEKNTAGWYSWFMGKGKWKKPLKGMPLKHYLRWEKPELNGFLLMPLAKSAGGLEMNGNVVFKDTNDPDYQKLLRAFDPIQRRISRLPRMDMPGAKEVRGPNHSACYLEKETP